VVAVDRQANPCADFYQYACGGWMARNPIPADHDRWDRFEELQERNREILREILERASQAPATRIGDYYAACRDEKAADAKGIAPIKPVLDAIAALPNKSAITAQLARLNANGVHPFFSIDSSPDFKNSAMTIAELDQGGMALPDRDYYLKADPKSVELRRQYLAHVTRMFVQLGDPSVDAAKRAQAVMKIENRLASAALDRAARRDPNRVYHKYTVAELISLAPGIDWRKYFDDIGLPGLDSLNVSEPNFTRAIEAAMVQNSLEDLKSYLTWHVLHAHAPFLSAPFVDEDFDFFGRILTGSKQLRARWNRCVIYTDDQLRDDLSRAYVDKVFGPGAKNRTLHMVRNLEAALQRDIEGLDWMSPETKKQALVKFHAIVNKIGYPEKWRDYSTVRVVRNDFVGNVDRLSEYEFQRVLSKVGKPVDKTEWEMSPSTVNAYYSPTMNDINFPAGILQPPFFAEEAGDFLNYGAIGSVIGHELTHGFDDEGRLFDARGNLKDWWTPEDARRFEQRSECIVKEYSGFTAVDDVKLNGKLTLGENTADNGGVRIAHMAMRAAVENGNPAKNSDFTTEQQFFLGWAQMWCENATEESERLSATVDPHSPGRYRVNGTLRNMPEFGKAFSCPAGAPMTASPVCRVW
jgi:endothelin-converting enzyme/putative endopeptidase